MKQELSFNFSTDEIGVLIGDRIIPNLSDILLERARSSSFYVLVDSVVFHKYSSYFQPIFQRPEVNFTVLDAGKKNKTFATAMKVFADLDDKDIARDVAIVAVGGGVIGDLGGFVASCWYRGVELIHVPTTLLAAVDSCLGGKTALNFRHTVNAVGTYHHPSVILIDTEILANIPSREFYSGFGEIIKYAALGCAEILEILEASEEPSSRQLATLVALSLTEKAKYVRGDVKESSNRLYLNFGHTIGHAIEFSTIYNGDETFRHGEGVGLGMIAIFRVCVILGYLQESDIDRLKSLLVEHNLPIKLSPHLPASHTESLTDLIVSRAFKDKKRNADGLRLVLLDGWGKPFIYPTLDANLIKAGVEELTE